MWGDLFFRKSKEKKFQRNGAQLFIPFTAKETEQHSFLLLKSGHKRKPRTSQRRPVYSGKLMPIFLQLLSYSQLCNVLMTTCLEENKCTSECSFCTQKYEVWGEKRISTQEEEEESMLCSHIEDVPQHGTFSWSLQEELKFPACHAVITSVWCLHGTFQISSHKVSAHSTRILRKWKFCVNGMFLRHTSLFPASKGKICFWGFI